MSKFSEYPKGVQEKIDEALRQINQKAGGKPCVNLPPSDMTLSIDSPSEEDLDNPGKGENRGR